MIKTSEFSKEVCMKKVLSVILLILVTLSAQELGLETDSGTISSFEEELLLIGVDDLLVDDIIVAKEISEDSITAENVVDSSTVMTMTDSTVNPAIESDSLSTTNDSSLALTDTADLETSLIEEDIVPETDSVALAMAIAEVTAVSSVDVEGSLEGYRSPRRAMFFSLAVPGAGQAYVGKYWKTGLFVALEAAAIVGAVHFKKEGDDFQNKAYSHYDKSFSVDKLDTFLVDLTNYGKVQTGGDYANLTEEERIIKVDEVIFGSNIYNDSTLTTVQEYLEGFNLDPHKGAQQDIALQGWLDATPGYTPNSSPEGEFYNISGTGMFVDTDNFLHLHGGDTRYGSSAYRNEYIDILAESEQNYDLSRAMVIGILVNHVVSATDAYISATRYNRELMNEKNSVLSRISIDNQLYISERGELTTGVSVAWNF